MTKIKKSIWSAVVGLVMCLTLVFGVVAGVNANRVANADPEPEIDYSSEFVAIIQQYFPKKSGINTSMITDATATGLVINDQEVNTYTKLSAYERACFLYTLLTEDQQEDVLVVAAKAQLDYIYTTVFEAPDAVIKMINEDLGKYISDSEYYEAPETVYYKAASFGYAVYDANHAATGYEYSEADLDTAITYNQRELVANVDTAYNALDADQKLYVSWNTRDLYNKKAARSALTTMEGYLEDVIDGALELYPQVVGGVYYSFKGDYEALVAVYNKLDPAAQAGTEITNSLYPDVAGLDEVFADIENAANTAKTSIADLEYYSFTAKELEKVSLETEIVYSQEFIFDFSVGENNYRIVVDTKPSFETATAALDAIYNGRTVNEFKVANCKVANLSETERTALASYLTELNRYDKVEAVLSLYQQYADLTSEEIDGVNVTGENHYKVPEVEEAIGRVYADYKALYDSSCMDADEEYSFNNVQKLISEENQAKIEGYKETLDTLNDWIKKVANLVKAKNEQNCMSFSADLIIEWAWNKLQAEEPFGFDVDDKDVVEALLHGTEATEELEAVDGYDQLVASEAETEEQPKTNALQKPYEVLVYLEGLIDDALEEETNRVKRLEELLVEMKNVLTEGVKYADRVLVDEFDELVLQISGTSRATVEQSENYKYYEALQEALSVIWERVTGVVSQGVVEVEGVATAIDSILYRDQEDELYYLTVDVAEIVVASKESVEKAERLVAAVYNGDELVAENQVEYKLATLTYAEWATEDVVETADGDVNAFVYYFEEEFGVSEYFEKFEAAVADLNALKEEAAAVDTAIANLVITNYRAQRAEIEALYNTYVELDRGEFNNLQDWVSNKLKLEDAYLTLTKLDVWVCGVALKIDSYNDPAHLSVVALPTVAEVDAFIAETTVEDVKLTFAEVAELLEVYEQFTVVDDEDETAVRQLSVKEAYDLLVARQEQLEEEVEDLQSDLDDLSTLLEEGVKYADKVTFDALSARVEELEALGAELDTDNLDALGEALDEIKTRAENAQEFIDEILYRYYDDEEETYALGTYEEAGEDGEVVVRSRQSVEAAQAAVAAVYNGDELVAENQVEYKIATLTYAEWATEDVVETADGNVNAFVCYAVLTADDYARYESAVEAIEERKELAQEFVDACDALELSVENNYKVKEEDIEALYAQYEELNLGELDNVQEWVDEPRTTKVESAKNTLDALNAWLEAVANAIDQEATDEKGADAVIADAIASVAEGNELDLTLPVVNALLDYHARVTEVDDQDETAVRKASVQDAYELLSARKQDIEDAAEELQAELDELETEAVKYSDKDKYEELKERAEELEELGVELDTENLETVGEALETIEERTNALKEALDNIEYYLDGEMVTDPTGEVVYDTKESLDLATAKVQAVYDGTENVAELEFPWGETEENALDKWSELTGIKVEDLAKYKAAYEEFNRLWDIEKAVAARIDDLTFTEENHLKAQAETVEELVLDTYRLMHEGQVLLLVGVESDETYNMHNNWMAELTDDQTVKVTLTYMCLEMVNGFDNAVAQLCDETVTEETSVADVDALIAQKLEEGFDDEVVFDLVGVEEAQLAYAFSHFFATDEDFPSLEVGFVAAAQPAKDVLDMMYNRARELNNDLAEKIVDILDRAAEDALVEADYETILYVKETYEQLTDVQKAILENTELQIGTVTVTDDETGEEEELPEYLNRTQYYEAEPAWLNIDPYTMEEFFNIAQRFEGANYYKQAVEELVTQLGEEYFTVEGYVLEKGLLAMYFTFDDEMKAMVESAYHKLLNIDAAYKEVNREDYTSYTSVTENLEGQLEDAKTELAAVQSTLEADIIEALGIENVETVKEALVAYKAAVAQAQADLEAAQAALVASITNSLDPETETVEAAFESYKTKVAQAQTDLEAAQAELVNEIKTALGEEDAATVQAALEAYKKAVADAQDELEQNQEELEQSQEEAAKASEDSDKVQDEKVAKLKKALIITAIVGGVVAVAAVACIVVLFAKMSALGGAAASSSSAAAEGGAEGGKKE